MNLCAYGGGCAGDVSTVPLNIIVLDPNAPKKLQYLQSSHIYLRKPRRKLTLVSIVILIDFDCFQLYSFLHIYWFFWDVKASEVEIEKTTSKGVKELEVKPSHPKASAKAKATAKAKSGEKHLRSPQKVDQPSPNPTVPKRVRGKQPAEEAMDSAHLIAELREARDFS